MAINIHDEEQRITESISKKLDYINGATQYKIEHHWDFEEIQGYIATMEYTLKQMKIENEYMIELFRIAKGRAG